MRGKCPWVWIDSILCFVFLMALLVFTPSPARHLLFLPHTYASLHKHNVLSVTLNLSPFLSPSTAPTRTLPRALSLSLTLSLLSLRHCWFLWLCHFSKKSSVSFVHAHFLSLSSRLFLFLSVFLSLSLYSGTLPYSLEFDPFFSFPQRRF